MIDFNCYYFFMQIEDESINFCSFYNLLTNELKEKSVVNMTFTMYHDGIFYLRDKLFGKSFSLLSDMIKEYCSLNFHPYCPHNEEVCLGKYPGITIFVYILCLFFLLCHSLPIIWGQPCKTYTST